VSKSSQRTGRWFAEQPPVPDAVIQLVCLPHAGAGAATYREWQSNLGPAVEVITPQLPGREARFSEPSATSTAEVVDALVEPLLERLDDPSAPLPTGAEGRPARPFALFGHSMGALLSYELAHELVRRGRPPAHLFVSGYSAPHLPRNPRYDVVHELPDAELIEHIAALQGTDGAVLEHPELIQMLLPVMRADYKVCETHRYTERPPLSLPVTALGGTTDPGVPEENLRAWGDLTESELVVRQFPGGHFYLHARFDEVMDVLRAALAAGGRLSGGTRR
jgi:medium-chain acyl-[acyl-carrier-protein] hydrolase